MTHLQFTTKIKKQFTLTQRKKQEMFLLERAETIYNIQKSFFTWNNVSKTAFSLKMFCITVLRCGVGLCVKKRKKLQNAIYGLNAVMNRILILRAPMPKGN